VRIAWTEGAPLRTVRSIPDPTAKGVCDGPAHHRNPYSGLRPVDDPALAMIEICNEHGFFIYPDKLETLAEPYATDLKGRWNLWLRERYGTTERLEAAWERWGTLLFWRGRRSHAKDGAAAYAGQSPDATARVTSAARLAPARQRDGVEFLVSVQRAYFREMRDHLRSIGLRIPVTAVVSSSLRRMSRPWRRSVISPRKTGMEKGRGRSAHTENPLLQQPQLPAKR